MGSRQVRRTVFVGWMVGEHTYRDAGAAYAATPELIAYLGIDPSSIEPSTVLLTSMAQDLYFVNVASQTRDPIANVQRFDATELSSIPQTLITQHGLDVAGWRTLTAGWLIDSDRPFTDSDLAEIREDAARAGLFVESRHDQSGLETLRTAAAASGIGLALAILAMAVGLIRGEDASGVRTLTAVGASSRTRRAITASTAGALAILAVVLGTGGAYVALLAGYTPELDRLGNIPVAHLVAISAGLPTVAIVAGWLLAGRQPRHIGRRLTE